MTQTLVVLRTGGTEIQDIPASSTTPPGTPVGRAADATHADGAAVTTHVDSTPVLAAAAQISAAAPSVSTAPDLPAGTITPMSSSMQGSNPVTTTLASDSHTDSPSDLGSGIARSASFDLPFTHDVMSGSDITYVTQDDGSIVAADADTGLITDWTIIV